MRLHPGWIQEALAFWLYGQILGFTAIFSMARIRKCLVVQDAKPEIFDRCTDVRGCDPFSERIEHAQLLLERCKHRVKRRFLARGRNIIRHAAKSQVMHVPAPCLAGRRERDTCPSER